MTYKHVKFEDSSVMRSLEKVAVQKGLVKPEPMTKMATTTTVNLVPTASLTQNIIKLCGGLRQKGLHTYADELEVQLLNYKRAQTLYETSPEQGKDVIEFAHPQGSHKLEDVESDEAVFEDVLDQKLKMLEMINKNPTGKLSSLQAIQAVRVIFAQNQEDQQLQGKIAGLTGKINNMIAVIDAKTSSELTFSITAAYTDKIRELLKNPTVDNLQAADNLFDRLHARLDPESWFHYTMLGTAGLSQDTWAQVEPLITKAKQYIQQALILRTKYTSMQSNELMQIGDETTAPTADPLVANYQNLLQDLNQSVLKLNSINSPNKDKISSWLSNVVMEVNEKMVALKSNSDPAAKPQFQQYYDKTNAQVQRVEQWIQQNSNRA